MTTKAKQVQNMKDLTKVTEEFGGFAVQNLGELRPRVTALFKALAATVKTALGTDEAAPVYAALEGWVKNLDQMKKALSEGLKQQVRKTGREVGEKGSKELVISNHRVTVVARGRDTYDAKKVEGLLRANNIDVSRYMKQVVTYEIDPDKLKALIDAGWGEALETCRKDVNYALSAPEPISDTEV